MGSLNEDHNKLNKFLTVEKLLPEIFSDPSVFLYILTLPVLVFVYFSFFLFENEIICSLVLAKRMQNFLLKENLFSDERQLF